MRHCYLLIKRATPSWCEILAGVTGYVCWKKQTNMKIPQQNHHQMKKLFLTNLGIESWRLTQIELKNKQKEFPVLQVQLTSILPWIWFPLGQQSPISLVPGTGFMEEKFPTDQVRGAGVISGWFKCITFIVCCISTTITSAPPQIIRVSA